MLGSLTGTITAKLGNKILLEVNSIGYWIHTGAWQPEGTITCYLHHHVREDASDLYGFSTIADLQLFEQLIGISGIGPKAALALLSLGTSQRILDAIEQKDLTFLTHAPGIGQKAAQKIVLELHSKLDTLAGLMEGDSAEGELSQALESLGYKQKEIRSITANLPSSLETVEAQIKWALQQFSK